MLGHLGFTAEATGLFWDSDGGAGFGGWWFHGVGGLGNWNCRRDVELLNWFVMTDGCDLGGTVASLNSRGEGGSVKQKWWLPTQEGICGCNSGAIDWKNS